MSEKCPVCDHTVADSATECDNCGFKDERGVNRVWVNPEDYNRWLETVVKPYRVGWERKQKEELQGQLEAVKESAKRRDDDLSAEIGKLKNRVAELESAIAQLLPPPPPPPRLYKYLLSISGNCFRSVSDQPQGSFYGMFDEHNGVASFEFCGDASTALANPDAYIYGMCDICEIDGDLIGADTIKNICPGRVTWQSGAGWIVIIKAKITLG